MKIARNISLSYLGENHKDDYLKFSDITYKEAKELQNLEGEDGAEQFLGILKGKLMGGSITDDETNQKVTVTGDTLEDLPVSMLTSVVEKLVGGADANLG